MSFEELLANFPDLEKDVCYRILENSIYYLEEIKDSITNFKSEEEYWNLCIENDNLKELLLLENEFSIMKNEDSKKCDWVIFGNNNLYFIESKIELDSLTIISQICFKSKSKIVKAGDQARKVLFKQYNSDFKEGNYISFD